MALRVKDVEFVAGRAGQQREDESSIAMCWV